MHLNEAEHHRISDAITSAERMTSGEIFCVVTQQTDDYRAVPFAWAALVAIVLPPLMLWVLPDPLWFIDGSWNGGASVSHRHVVALYAALCAILFVVTFLLARIPSVLRALTPGSLKRAAVHRAALESFLSHGIHVTDARTGILIFLSLDDHIAEIVADRGIYDRVEHDIWGDTLEALLAEVREGRIADGFVAAIGLCGSVLAAHFPPCARNPNELPDRLIEI